MTRGNRGVKRKETIVVTNCIVQRNNTSPQTIENDSFTGENEKLRMSMPSARVPSDGEKWAGEVEATFVDLMYTEILRGNIYTISFTPSVLKDIMNNLALQTGLAYNIKKLKSKHSRLKELWRRFHELMVQETGLGWDDATNMSVGSTELWQSIIQRNPKHAELRHKGCSHYHKLTTIFSGQTATGFAARGSTQMPFTESGGGSASATHELGNENADGQSGPSLMQRQSSRRQSSHNRRLSDDREILMAILDKIAESSTNASAVQVDRMSNVPQCTLDALREIPDLPHHRWQQAVEFLEDKTRRSFFLAMTQAQRLLYLQGRLGW